MLDRMHVLLRLLGSSALIASAGCGLVLDASARTDAAVSEDARGMDAFVDRGDAQSDDDALVEPEIDAFEHVNVMDAVILPEEDVGGMTVGPDALFPFPDAAFDARSDDAALSPIVDTGVDAAHPSDGGLDAALDASECPASCPPIATALSCQPSACVGVRCVAAGGVMPCPAAGSCEQTCGGASGPLGCAWRGTACSPPLGGCSTDANCRAGSRCAEVGTCRTRICLPTCDEPGMTCTFSVDGTVYTSMCDARSFCMPTALPCE